MRKVSPNNRGVLEVKTFPRFVLKKLKRQDANPDYQAVMANSSLIRKLTNTEWPPNNLSFESNYQDLCRHEEEFDRGVSFTYGIWSPDEKEYWGSLYLYLEERPWFRAPKDCDVVVEMWVIQKVYDSGNYAEFIEEVRAWLVKEWPFKRPYFNIH